MLFFQVYSIFFFLFFTFCVLLYLLLSSLNIENQSKTLVFKKYKRLLYKCYREFVKMFTKQPNKFDIRQFLVLLYDCVPSMKNYYSIGRLVKNLDVLEAGTVKTPNTA